MKTEKQIRTLVRNAAFRVEFLVTYREIKLYTDAVYAAILWGWREQIKDN